jgi:hypothetical protein
MTREKLGQYFCYLASLVFCWVLIGQLIQTNLTIDKLVKVSGTIDQAIEVSKYRRKSYSKDYELRIFLKDTTEYFRLMDIYKYDHFRELINNGDTAEVYIRPKWLVPLGLGYRNDIFQMTLNGQTIFEISQTKRNGNGIIIVSLIAIPIFLFLPRYLKRKRRAGPSSSSNHMRPD